MSFQFIADEVFINDKTYSIDNNWLLFETPTQFVGKSAWRVKNNSTGEVYVASFSGINVDTSSEDIEVYHKGELLGENTEGKTPYLLVMGVGGIQGMLFSVIKS